ncbi:MAG: 1-acyl-sn-glycerol-3-phosphate acyltransferase [Spirochaetes bacterium]|nr:1-acyl-sn-glycerol-3-phosphate acyltransferase [Spirochaetota bacterium]
MAETLTSFFGGHMKKALSLSKVPGEINESNVFQEGHPGILAVLDDMVETLLLPGSGLDGLEHLEELMEKAEAGKSCLLLPEHYSNMDLSIISLIARKAGGRGGDIAKAIVALSGVKLNEDNPGVAAYAGAYSRIVIYPSRQMPEGDSEKDKAELLRAAAINRAAMKAVNEKKAAGKLILIFPAGTRYRPWDPQTKKGVREIDSYIRSFDYMCFIAINGQLLHLQEKDMLDDIVEKDLVRVTAGPVISCSEFRRQIKAEIDDDEKDEDQKRVVADVIMAILEEMHVEAEAKRQKLIGAK